MSNIKYENGEQPYRKRYSVDLHEYDDLILAIAKKENRGKANMTKQLIYEALVARGAINQ